MRTVEVTVKGISPLLMNRFPEPGETKTATKRTAGQKERDPKDCLYVLPNGKLYQPAEHFRQSMIESSKNFRIGKKSYMRLVSSSVVVEPEALIHKNQKWVVDRRSVVNPSTKGRVMKSRPRLDDWEVDFKIVILDDDISLSAIKDILEYAGKYIGVGDYRPTHKGWFGKFMVTVFKEKK